MKIIECPWCKKLLPVDDTKGSVFCCRCGTKIDLSSAKVIIDEPDEAGLESLRKLRKQRLQQKDDEKVTDCCRIIVEYDKKDWKAWAWLTVFPHSINDYHICLDNAIRYCDDDSAIKGLIQMKNELALVTLRCTEYKFKLRGIKLAVNLFPMIDTFGVRNWNGVVIMPPPMHDVTLLISKGKHDFFYVSDKKKTIDVQEDIGIFPEKDLQMSVKRILALDADIPYVTTFKADPDEVIEEFDMMLPIKVFVDEHLKELNLEINGKLPEFHTEDEKTYVEATAPVNITNHADYEDFDTKIEIRTLRDVVLRANREEVTAKVKKSRFKHETIHGVRYNLSYEEADPNPHPENYFDPPESQSQK